MPGCPKELDDVKQKGISDGPEVDSARLYCSNRSIRAFKGMITGLSFREDPISVATKTWSR